MKQLFLSLIILFSYPQLAMTEEQKASDSEQQWACAIVLEQHVSRLEQAARDHKSLASEEEKMASHFKQQASASELEQEVSKFNWLASDFERRASVLEQQASVLEQSANSYKKIASEYKQKASDSEQQTCTGLLEQHAIEYEQKGIVDEKGHREYEQADIVLEWMVSVIEQ